ncbi:MAG: site-2 protease family protein [Clostridia bacterium]
MENVDKLQVVEDLTLFEDPGLRKKKYFLLSDSREIYLKLDEQRFHFFKMLIPYLHGTDTKEIIEEKICEDVGKPVKITKALEFLDKIGLLVNSTKQNQSKVELELSGRKVLEIPLEGLQKKYSWFLKVVLRILMTVSAVSIVYSVIIAAANSNAVLETYLESKRFNWSQVSTWEYLIVFSGFLISVVVHELGHILTANHLGVSIKSFNLILFMGISPTFYIKYKNYYATSSITKICILLAGVFFNIVQASVFWILLYHFTDWKYAALMIFNLGCIISNLSLLGSSDGYYVGAILLDIEGLRWNMLKTVGNVLNKKSTYRELLTSSKNVLMIAYFSISYGFAFIGLYFLINLIVDFLNLQVIDSTLVAVLVCLFLILNIVHSLKKFICSLKSISR